MDEETIDLILNLQMEDLQSLASKRKGKAKEGSRATDEELAVNLQANEVQRHRTALADLRMARSIGRAVQDDGAAVTILVAEERRSTYDHEMACRLSGGPAQVGSKLPDNQVDNDFLSKFSSFNVSRAPDTDSCYSESVISFNDTDVAESSSWAAGRKTTQSKARHECVACAEIRDTVQMSCKHQYCQACIIKLFTDATVDESLFPPRCCGQTMPLSLVRPYIGADLTIRIEQKAIEFGTSDRTYCFGCGSFVSLYNIEGNKGHCFSCNRNTCILCKAKFHDGDCPKDTALEDVLRIATEAGWQRCLGCQALVERREGCNHMT